MSSLDLERLKGDLIPKLTPTIRRELRYLVSGLKTRKEIGGIPSVSAALVARAPRLSRHARCAAPELLRKH